MRRFVSAFSLKRDKHGQHRAGTVATSPKSPLSPLDIPPVEPRPNALRSPASSSISTPPLSLDGTDPSSHSSHSSASGSGIKTPDDAHLVSLARSSTKRSWRNWIPKKRSSTMKHRDRKDKSDSPPVDPPLPSWDSSEPPVASPLSQPAFLSPRSTVDTDDDIHASSVSDFDIGSPAGASQSPAVALRNLSVLIKNSASVTAAQPSPFVQPASGPIYPRSCNPPQALRKQPSLRSTVLTQHLSQRVDDPSFLALDDPSILALASRSAPIELPPPPLPESSIPYPGKSTKILPFSPGLHRWICRPGFEDRFHIFLATDAGVMPKPVSSSLAVAALEYSEVLDVMVDPDFALVLDKALPPSPPLPPVHSSSSAAPEPVPVPQPGKSLLPPTLLLDSMINSHLSAPVVTTPRNSFMANPSPLRIEHNSAPSEASTDSPKEPTVAPVPVKKPATVSTAAKRVVRFAEDDDDEDDVVPLHLLRARKKREEKAKFLRMEQQRRMKEQFEEQKRQQAEALERESKKLAAQKEREERDKRLYAEQVSASRLRSEQSRAGAFAINSGSSSSLLVPPLASSVHAREAERNYPPASKGYSSLHGRRSSPGQDLGSPYQSSSGDSRPPSIASPNIGGNRSRPGSTHSSSSEDARPGYNNRRNSVANSANSLRSMTVPYPVYPAWTGSSQSLHGMQMQMLPNFADFSAVHDMPLLPPSAPFMKRSRQSSPESSKRDSSHSNERSQSSSKKNRDSSGSLSPSSSEFQPSHVRQSSGDSRNSSRSQLTMDSSKSRSRPAPSSSQSHSSLPRGRPPLPGFSSTPQVPTPWTALPSRSGTVPKAMPVSPYSQSSLPRNRNSGFVAPMGHDWRSTLIS